MEIKTIVFLMMLILAVVFIASYFLIPKEKKKMALEAQYADLVLKAISSNLKENFDEVRALGIKLGKSSEEVERDLTYSQQG